MCYFKAEIDFLSHQCLPFWPENLSGKLCIRVIGCESVSKPFFYNRQDNGTLLSLEELVSSFKGDLPLYKNHSR